MNFRMPKGFKEWGMWLAIGSFILDKVIKLFKFLFNSRGSSYETKKEIDRIEKSTEKRFDKAEEDNIKRHEETKKLINEIKSSFEMSFEKLVSKEMFELKIEALKKEIQNDNELNFLRIQATADKAIEASNESKSEHRASKIRIDEVYGRFLEEKMSKKKNVKKRK